LLQPADSLQESCKAKNIFIMLCKLKLIAACLIAIAFISACHPPMNGTKSTLEATAVNSKTASTSSNASQQAMLVDAPQASTTQLSEAAQINAQLGLYYLEQKNIPASKAKLLLALAQAPHDPLVNDAIGYFYEKTADARNAERYYLVAIKFSTKAGATHNNYGAFLYHQHRYQEALTQFVAATKDGAYLNTAAAFKNAGYTALALSDNNAAHIYFNKSMAIDPHQ
jgi:type IV pilus biogenesis/stability protein PilW